jgi:SEC-C motif-containing protein
MRWYLLDRTGVVEFSSRYRVGEERGEQHEVSRIVRQHGRWFYVDAIG